MFANTSFNQDISNWNTSEVTSMYGMFYHAENFNQDIGNWNTANVTNMRQMFYRADSFDQNLSSWNIENVTDVYYMFKLDNLSISNYDALLESFNLQNLQNGLSFHGGYSKYCTAENARANIISNDNWSIVDGGKDCAPNLAPDLQSSSDTGISNTDNITSDNTPTFDLFCRKIGTILHLKIDGNDVETHNCVGAGTTESITLSTALADGNHVVTYYEVDGGDTSSDSPILNFSIDQINPILTNNLNATAPHSVDNPELIFSATDNISIDHYEITYQEDNNGAGVSGTTTSITQANSPITLDLDPDEVYHTVVIKVYDTAGNYSQVILKFPPIISFNSPFIDNQTMTGSVTITSPAGNDLSNITIDVGTTGASLGTCIGNGGDATEPYTSPVICDIDNITSSGNIKITADDSILGATGENSQYYTIDTVNSVITITAPTHLKNSSITDTEITVTDNNGIDVNDVIIKASSTVNTSNFVCTQTNSTKVDCTISIDGPTDGNLYNLVISATDIAGNSIDKTESGYRIDTTAPTLSEIIPISTPNNDNTPSYTFSYTDSTLGTSAWGGACNGYFSETINGVGSGNNTTVASIMPDGTYDDCTLTVTDEAGNSTQINISTFVIDTISPAIPVMINPTNTTVINDTTPTFSGTGEVGATVSVDDGNGHNCTAIVDAGGNWSCDISPALNDGANPSFSIHQTDLAGNVSSPDVQVNIIIDTTAPDQPTVTSPVNGEITSDTTPTFIGTGEVGATVSVDDGAGHSCSAIVNISGNWSCDISPALNDGANPSFSIHQTDSAGNQLSMGINISIEINLGGADDDHDGVSNEEEDLAINGDGNGDGIRDASQNNVTTVRNSITGSYTTIETDLENNGECHMVRNYEVINESSLEIQDSIYNYPVGLNNFEIECTSPGESTTIVLYYDKVYNTNNWKYKKYDTEGREYSDISDIVTFGDKIVGSKAVTTVSFTLTDGENETDQDKISNGVIIDPSGPAEMGQESSGGGGTETHDVINMCEDKTNKCYDIYPVKNKNIKVYEDYEKCIRGGSKSRFKCALEWALAVGYKEPKEISDKDIYIKKKKERIKKEEKIIEELKKEDDSCTYIEYKRFKNNEDFINNKLFKDAKTTDEGYKSLISLAKQGVIKGDDNTGNARLSDKINRAEFVKIITIAREDKLEIGKCLEMSKFLDLKKGFWYYNFVLNLEKHGIIHGYKDKNFKANRAINLAEVYKILAISFDYITKKEADHISKKYNLSWYKPYENVLKNKNLIPKRFSKYNLDYKALRSDVFDLLNNILLNIKK